MSFTDNFQTTPITNDVIVYQDATTTISTNRDWLNQQLSTCSNPPTYVELSALSIAQQGWQKVFDEWQDKGLVV